MHKPSAYERYLMDENRRYGYCLEDDNEIPSWLLHEQDTYYWVFRLSRRMYDPLNERTVSNQLLERIRDIQTIRYRKYRNISPPLKSAIESIVEEFVKLENDLQNPEMWKRKNCLSNIGLERWEKACHVVGAARSTKPDPEWRESWEKDISRPYCTRLEVEKIAIQYIEDHFGIDLSEKESSSGKNIYYCMRRAKNGIFKMRFGRWGRNDGENPFNDIGIIQVDMLTQQVKDIPSQELKED